MFIDGKIYKNFRIEDANTLISLEKWIRDNTDLYKKDVKISNEHLEVLIGYLKSKTKGPNILNRSDFISAFDALAARLEDGKRQ